MAPKEGEDSNKSPATVKPSSDSPSTSKTSDPTSQKAAEEPTKASATPDTGEKRRFKGKSDNCPRCGAPGSLGDCKLLVTLNCDPLRRSVHIEKEKGGHSITFLDSQRSSTHVWQFRGFGDSLSCQAGWHSLDILRSCLDGRSWSVNRCISYHTSTWTVPQKLHNECCSKTDYFNLANTFIKNLQSGLDTVFNYKQPASIID
ncbi:hypothetical protein M430DRAFT_43362 [Amorphotheca resinae ATCC 22711]|uniref:Uncharacterized protein n=1 Tax=Amorphotheca resinae ATCC 22711 TaxID=857342 RepID=A0A2T3AYI3_AMORE|nr:hypothetical protein M430DRAFT_43362 [Amorphotheca resinae ATCC 22711]PSS15101.1 hypothetical protein M430DRAFT_43362 [Amorphotheca resinae ATCC 22711]